MMQKELSVKECVEMAKAIDMIENSGIKVSIMASIDLAMNRKTLDPILVGWESGRKPDEKYVEFIRSKHLVKSPEELLALEDEYKEAITAEKEKIKQREETLKQKKTLDLIMIKSDAFKGESEFGPAIFTCLLPILNLEGAKDEEKN